MVDITPFERYRPIIDDWTAFAETLQRPLPTCVWTNTLRATPGEVEAHLREVGLDPEPLPWLDHAFRLPADVSAGNQLGYVTGRFHVQEEASLLPVPLLDPQPGERVLDLCAAPGGKTAQMGVRMQNRGTIVANDISYGRLASLRGTLDRLGLANVTATAFDGASYPAESGTFDRVLVDAPCSCEGTSRKHPSVIDPWASMPDITGLQSALLRKAVQRCRPGGRIVYSTCTYAPEENEQIVDGVLRRYDDILRVVPARLDGVTMSPGLQHWNGHTFRPALADTMRVWPHQNDTGGFFVAVLERLE